MAEVQTTFQDTDANGKAIKIINFAGQLDETNVDEEAKKIYQVIDEMAEPNLLLDFSQLAYMNSKSIGYVTDWYSRVSAKNGKIAITSPRPNILDILKVVGITQIITIYENPDEAKLAFSGAAADATTVTPAAETPAVPAATVTPAPATETPAETPVAETAPTAPVATEEPKPEQPSAEAPAEPVEVPAEPSSAEAPEEPVEIPAATEEPEPTEPAPVAAAPVAPETPVTPATPPAPAEGGEPVETETPAVPPSGTQPAETPPPATPPAA